MGVHWQTDLDRWLAPFVAALRHKTRSRMCPVYIAGLIGPGDRKSCTRRLNRSYPDFPMAPLLLSHGPAIAN